MELQRGHPASWMASRPACHASSATVASVPWYPELQTAQTACMSPRLSPCPVPSALLSLSSEFARLLTHPSHGGSVPFLQGPSLDPPPAFWCSPEAPCASLLWHLPHGVEDGCLLVPRAVKGRGHTISSLTPQPGTLQELNKDVLCAELKSRSLSFNLGDFLYMNVHTRTCMNRVEQRSLGLH